MRLLCLIPHPQDGASGRQRVSQYLPWLASRGVTAQVRPFMSPTLYRILYQPGNLPRKLSLSTVAVLKRLTDVARAARADVVLVHREALPLGTVVIERLVRRRCPAVVFDFDDAIYLSHSSHANTWTRRFRNAQKTADIIALSREVIAGNRVLAEYARHYCPRVSVIPTPVDTDHFTCRPESTASRLVIGWMGSHTTAHYLAALQRPLERILSRYPHVEVRIVGAGAAPLRLARLTSLPWQLDQERAHLHSFDIGIMPMPNDPWTQGKCGFKALLYMSVGIPVLASPVGVNTEIVQEGVTGFLPIDETQWSERLSELIEDRMLRQKLGEAGRAAVEGEYSVRANAPRLLQVLARAADERATGRPRAETPIGDALISVTGPGQGERGRR